MRRSMTRRMPASVLAFGLTGLVGAASAPAQEFGFRSLGAAERAAERIMEASGLTADFEIVVDPGSDNAAAGISSPCGHLRSCRVILYDPDFLRDIERRTDEWGPISIMAHEVAHHLQGHTVFGEGSIPPNELDADFYSGFVLQKLGASLESAQAAMRLIASPRGSSSHPPRRERLEYIARGWRKAAADGGAGGGSARRALEEMREELRRMEERLQVSERQAREAQARVNQAEEERAAAEARRDEAEEALRDVRARGEATEAELRQAEDRLEEANDQARRAEDQLGEAQAALDVAEKGLEQARAENERIGERAETAVETADRAFMTAVLLVPLVLFALLLGFRKPRQRAKRAVDAFSYRFSGFISRDHWGNIIPEPSPPPEPPPSVPSPSFDNGRQQVPVPPRPTPSFDGSGLERCAEPGGFVLGRDGALVDAVVDHRSVSRRHVRLTRLDGRLRVEDLNSTNGTRVNGRRLEPFAPCVLAPGDAVALGDVHLALAV